MPVCKETGVKAWADKMKTGATMLYLDIHAHFAEEGYDFPAEWQKIQSAGVEKVVLAGDTLAHSAWHAQFCREHEGAYFTVGVHPSAAAEWSEGDLSLFEALCRNEKCVAVGEIGLDYHYPGIDRERQLAVFRRQIELAEAFNLPLQLHSREAAADTLQVLRDMRGHLKRGFLLHCYSYSRELMGEFLSLGAYFSFGGVACFKNAKKTAECVAACPPDRILSETDSPYLSPFRGEKNSPCNIPVIVQRLAHIRGEREEVLCEAIARNAFSLFPKLV